MRDRLPLYPGRVKMVPVAGQENVYDMTRADQPTQEGDPLNKATLLKDATATLFGLGADSVPDEAFAYLGKYAQHWWRRRTPAISGYVEVKEKVSKMYTIVGLDRTVKYSKNITIDKQTGAISLVAPKSLTCVHNTYGPTDFMSTLCAESPLYFTAKGDNDYETLYYLPSKSTYYDRSWTENPYTLVGYYNSNTNVMYVEIASSAPDSKKASLVTSFYNNGEPGEWEYLQSSDRSAYPDSGEQNGYEYQYLGIPFDNAVTAPKISTGSYVGTETSRTISVSFNSPITAFIICALDKVVVSGSVRDWSIGIYLRGSKKMASLRYDSIRDLDVSISDDGKTISWSGSANYSDLPFTFNANGTYLYMAIHG